MSETSLSFLTATDAAVDLPDDAEAGSRTRVLALAAALALALAVGGVTVLTGGEADVVVAAPAARAAAPQPDPAAPAAPASPTAPAQAAPAVVGRDPFRVPDSAALPAEESAPAASAPVPTAPDEGVARPDDPAPAPLPPAGEAGETSPPIADPAPPPITRPVTPPVAPASRRLSLSGVRGSAEARTAVLTVDGATVPVAVGGSFGGSSDLLLVSIQEGPGTGQWTAVVRQHDGEPFDVVTGAPVTVT